MRNPANKQTNADEHITSLAEVNICQSSFQYTEDKTEDISSDNRHIIIILLIKILHIMKNEFNVVDSTSYDLMMMPHQSMKVLRTAYGDLV